MAAIWNKSVGLESPPTPSLAASTSFVGGSFSPDAFRSGRRDLKQERQAHGSHHRPHQSNFAESVVSPPVRAGMQRTRAYRPADTTKANATRFAVHPRIRHPSSLSSLSLRRHRAGIGHPPVSSYRRRIGATPAHAQLRAAGYVEACALARGDLPTDTAAASFPRCRPDTDGPQVPRKGRGF
ncbi:hypothetical protein [Lysobacter capsici]|uniref:hypothetical protein n=1 Tax=Lysobacter capsici TaxID=435897 RepID=UPI003CCD60A0